MPERVTEDRDTSRTGLLGTSVQHRTGRGDPGCEIVDVVDTQVQGHGRAPARRGRRDVDLRVLVGHHPVGAVQVQLDVSDPAVRHDDRLVGHRGAELLDVPGDRGARVAHREVRGQLSHPPSFASICWQPGVKIAPGQEVARIRGRRTAAVLDHLRQRFEPGAHRRQRLTTCRRHYG
jgi:hypothetical protein